MYCPDCGREAGVGDRTCRECGRALGLLVRDPDIGGTITFDGETYLLASFWRRVGAFIIDGVLIYFAYSIVLAVAMVARPPDQSADPFAQAMGAMRTLFLISPVIGLVLAGFFWLCDSIGWTPGKRVLGLRVVRWDGSMPGAAHGLIRYGGRVLGMLVMYIGVLWVAWDRYAQGWHDKMAQTYVVRVPADFRFHPPVTDLAQVVEGRYSPGPRGHCGGEPCG